MKKSTNFNRNKAKAPAAQLPQTNSLFFRHLNKKQTQGLRHNWRRHESLKTPLHKHRSSIVHLAKQMVPAAQLPVQIQDLQTLDKAKNRLYSSAHAESTSREHIDLDGVVTDVNQRFARDKKPFSSAKPSTSVEVDSTLVESTWGLPRVASILPSKIESCPSKRKKRLHNQILQFLKCSSHFGRKSRHLDFAFPWHASMCNKFSGVRNKVAHINAQQTFQSLVEAFYFIALVLRKGGKVLVINKNSEFSSLFYPNNLDPSILQAKHTPCFASNNSSTHEENTSTPLLTQRVQVESTFLERRLKEDLCAPPKPLEQPSNLQSQEKDFQDFANANDVFCSKKQRFALERQGPATASLKWVGGCLTNWKEISKSVATLLYFSKRFGGFINQNNIHFPRFKKMKNSFQGFINIEKEQLLLKERPQLLFLFNAYESQQILDEAIELQIPVVALTDSSTDLSQITYPIPINSDSAHLVYWCFSQLIQIIERQERFSKSR